MNFGLYNPRFQEHKVKKRKAVELGPHVMHFHVTPRADAGKPEKVMVRLRQDGQDARAGLAVHAGVGPVHDGVASPLHDASGKYSGWLELKLHDDKGDLELWLTPRRAGGPPPMDLPLDARHHRRPSPATTADR